MPIADIGQITKPIQDEIYEVTKKIHLLGKIYMVQVLSLAKVLVVEKEFVVILPVVASDVNCFYACVFFVFFFVLKKTKFFENRVCLKTFYIKCLCR